jgi:hypothetical protein
MTKENKQEIARTLYLLSEKTQKEICLVVGWTEKTFIEQKRKGKWDELKDNRSLTKQQIVTILHSQTLKIIEVAKDEGRVLTAKEIDSIAKLASSIDKLEKKATIETYIEVFEEYNKWLMGVQPNFAQENNHYQDSFIHSKIVR